MNMPKRCGPRGARVWALCRARWTSRQAAGEVEHCGFRPTDSAPCSKSQLPSESMLNTAMQSNAHCDMPRGRAWGVHVLCEHQGSAKGLTHGAAEAAPGSRASCRAGLARIWALSSCKLGMQRTTLASYFRDFLAGGS